MAWDIRDWRSAAETHRERAAQSREWFARHVIRARGERRWRLQAPLADGRWDVHFWVEILVLDGGLVMVHGDIPPVIFSCYTDSDDPVAALRWIGASDDVSYYAAQKARIGTGEAVVDEYDRGVACYDIADMLRDDLLGLEAERWGAGPELSPLAPDEDPMVDLTPDERGERLLDLCRELAWTVRALGMLDDDDVPLRPLGDHETSTARHRRRTHARLRAKAEALEEIDDGQDTVPAVLHRLMEASDDYEGYNSTGRLVAWRVWQAHAALARLCALLEAERAPVTPGGSPGPFYLLSLKHSEGQLFARWWGPGNCGYSHNLAHAGIYTAAEIAAKRSCYENGDDWWSALPVPVALAESLQRTVPAERTVPVGAARALAESLRAALRAVDARSARPDETTTGA